MSEQKPFYKKPQIYIPVIAILGILALIILLAAFGIMLPASAYIMSKLGILGLYGKQALVITGFALLVLALVIYLLAIPTAGAAGYMIAKEDKISL